MKCALFIIAVFLIYPGCAKEDLNKEIRIQKKESAEENRTISDPDKATQNDQGVREAGTLIRISSKDIRKHIGDSLRITGYVAEVYLNDKVAYLNMENKFPKNTFSCAIFQSRFAEFGELAVYRGKNVEVTGRISTYKNKPQIILNSKDQIKITE